MDPYSPLRNKYLKSVLMPAFGVDDADRPVSRSPDQSISVDLLVLELRIVEFQCRFWYSLYTNNFAR